MVLLWGGQKFSPQNLTHHPTHTCTPPDADRKVRFKYPFAACEVLCCEIDALLDALVAPGSPHLTRLFSVLDAPRPLDCVRAGYFARLTARLLARRTGAVMGHLRTHRDCLTSLVAHVDTASVAEIVARLLGADDAMGLPASELDWLKASGVLDGLLDQLAPTAPPDAQKHAAAVLAAVVRAHGSPLLPAFADDAFLGKLLDRALAVGDEEGGKESDGGNGDAAPPPPTVPPPSPPSVQALEVAIALLEPKDAPADPHLLSAAAAAAATQVDIATKDAAVAGVVERLSSLVALLDGSGSGGNGGDAAASSSSRPPPQLTPYGVLDPPLGLTRIKAVALLVALLRTGRSAAVDGVVGAGAVSACLSLFTAYPFNNLLHHHVAALLLTALDGDGEGGAGPPALLAHVLEDAALPRWLATAPATVTPTPRPGDEARAAGRAPLRAGYLGHVTHLGNRLAALAAAGNAAVAAALAAEPAWAPWAEGDLRARTERDDPDAWACGRPAPAPFGAGLLGAPSLGEGDAYGGGWGTGVGVVADAGDDDGDGDGDAPTGSPPTRTALDLQQLAEAAASVGALRISGAVPEGDDDDGGASLSTSDDSSSDDSSDDDSDDGPPARAPAPPAASTSPPVPAPTAPAAAPAADSTWQAFPDVPPPPASPPLAADGVTRPPREGSPVGSSDDGKSK